MTRRPDFLGVLMAALPRRVRVTLRFVRAHGRLPRLRNPETLLDMIAQVMLCKTDPLVARTTDKVACAQWLQEIVDPAPLPTRFQVADRFDDLDLESLPPAVVIKASHGSGMTIVVTGAAQGQTPAPSDHRAVVFDQPLHEVDRTRLREITDRWLATDYADLADEGHYVGIPRRLIAEEYLGSAGGPLVEVGFYCVKGAVLYAKICQGRGIEQRVDRSYRQLAIIDVSSVPSTGSLPAKPAWFDEMVGIAERVAQHFPHVRVDFFRTADRTILGELTHTTSAGNVRYIPPDFAEVFGAFWRGERRIPERFYLSGHLEA